MLFSPHSIKLHCYLKYLPLPFDLGLKKWHQPVSEFGLRTSRRAALFTSQKHVMLLRVHLSPVRNTMKVYLFPWSTKHRLYLVSCKPLLMSVAAWEQSTFMQYLDNFVQIFNWTNHPQVYHIAREFYLELNLVVWQLGLKTIKLKSTNIIFTSAQNINEVIIQYLLVLSFYARCMYM